MTGRIVSGTIVRIAISASVLTLAAFSQSPRPSPETDQPKAISGAFGELSLDLIVRDKHGRPIRDLRPEEIKITDDGASVTIKALHPAARNKAAPEPVDPRRQLHLVSLVFDGLNSAARRLARKSALELIRTASGPQVYFSVWQISDRLQLLQQFTRDPVKLAQAIDSALPESRQGRTNASPQAQPGSAPAANDQPLESLASQMLTMSQKIAREENAQPSIFSLLALVRPQGTFPGRKSLLYIAEGQQIKSSAGGSLQSIIGAANRAQVSIYTIDTEGISPGALNDASEMMLSTIMDTAGAGLSPRATASLGEVSFRTLVRMETEKSKNSRSPLKELAAATGGFYIGDPNNFRKPLRAMAEDIGAYYEATYSPQLTENDGHFRNIAVTVARPHVRVQSRKGYFALPASGGLELASFEIPLLKALSASKKDETIPFRSQVLRYVARRGQPHAALVIEVPMNEVAFQEDDKNKLYQAHLSFVALVKASDGQVIRKLSRDVSVRGAAEHLEQSRAKTFTFERAFDILPGDYRVEIAISDQYANKISAKTVNFSIPASIEGLALSDVGVIGHFEPLDPTLDADEPLLYQNHRVVPDLTFAERAADTDLPIFFTVYPYPQSSEKPRLEMEVRKDDALIASVPLQTPDGPPGAPLSFVTAIRRDTLPAGAYQLRVRVAQGGVEREQSLAFLATGGPDATSAAPTEARNILNSTISPSLLAGLTRPPDSELDKVLQAARRRASDYQTELPNLICVEQTARSEDATGQEDWKYKDTIVRLLRYVDGEERRDVLQVNGHRALGASVDGIQITGEFGRLMNMVLSEKSQAQIDWQGMAEIAGTRTHVFRFRVAQEHSGWQLAANAGGRSVQAAYDALLYIDADTMGLQRITLNARDLPLSFPIQECVVTVDYDYVAIAGHDYLVPRQATLNAREGAHHLKKNEIHFVNYRKYGSESTIKFGQ